MITVKETKVGQHVCGFCSTGTHQFCPIGVVNGDGVTVYRCPCSCNEGQARCLNCRNLGAEDEVDPTTWLCIDLDDCSARREEKRRKALGNLGEFLEARKDPGAPEGREKAPRAPRRAASGSCLCCGEATGGGRFRPGHDSRYLSMVVGSVKEQGASVDGIAAIMAQEGCSEALIAKFRKRVA